MKTRVEGLDANSFDKRSEKRHDTSNSKWIEGFNSFFKIESFEQSHKKKNSVTLKSSHLKFTNLLT